ncbi:MAG TPA: glycosyltransferase family 4 protein [Pedobacter sp.]|nr:glycosyltransferase family 4 protein [Pedobacter sp.]
MIDKITEFNPNAILVYGWSYKSHLKALRYFKGKVPVWFRGDSNLLDEKPSLKKYLRRIFLTWVYRHIDKAFYVGKANKAYYKALGLKPQQLIFAPHAIDNDRFSQNRLEEVKELKKSLNIKNEEILIVFAGKFEEKKDPEILLSAFEELDNNNVHLLFVGNGKLNQHLEAKANMRSSSSINHARVTNKVHFLDFQNQSQMPVIYQACDLFCLPSKGPGETWGLAVNEAMAAGKAILVSNKVGCAQDLVVNSLNGFIFEAENKSNLLTRLQELTSEKGNLMEMGDQSSRIIDNWTIQIQSQIIMNELNAIN